MQIVEHLLDEVERCKNSVLSLWWQEANRWGSWREKEVLVGAVWGWYRNKSSRNISQWSCPIRANHQHLSTRQKGQTGPTAPTPAVLAAQFLQGTANRGASPRAVPGLALCSPRASFPRNKSLLPQESVQLLLWLLWALPLWKGKVREDERLLHSLVYFLLLLVMGGTKWSEMRNFLLEMLITFKLSVLSIIHSPFSGFKPLAVLFPLIVWGIPGL